MMGVYEIVNLENGKSYVGSSHDIKRRWYQHVWELNHRRLSNPHLQCAWDKYGEGAFSFCVLEEVDDIDDLLDREQYYLDRLFEADDNPYNIALDVQAPALGREVSEETRRKLSKVWKGRKHSEATRRKMGKAQKGHGVSDETRRRISEANKGREITGENLRKLREGYRQYIPTPEIKQKISDALTGRIFSDEHRKKLSEANKGKVLSEEHKRKIGESLKGRTFSEESLRKMGLAQKGRLVSEETRRKIGNASRGRRHSEESRHKMSMARKGKALSEKHRHSLSAASKKPYPAFIHCETGEIIPPSKNLAKMCREKGLDKGQMGKVRRGEHKQHRGWMLFVDSGGV